MKTNVRKSWLAEEQVQNSVHSACASILPNGLAMHRQVQFAKLNSIKIPLSRASAFPASQRSLDSLSSNEFIANKMC